MHIYQGLKLGNPCSNRVACLGIPLDQVLHPHSWGTSYRNPDLHNILSSAPFLFTFCFLNVENLSKIYTLHIYPILKVGSPHSNRVAVCLGVSLYQVLHHHSRCSTSDCNPNLHSILINNSLKCRKFV